MGMDHLNKAEAFRRENNWSQALRHSDLALTKLKQLKDCPLEEISFALNCKCTAQGFLGKNREQLECVKEWYCLWNTKPTDVGAINAAFFLIQSCIANKEFVDAHLYASTLYEIINHKHDNKIPEDQRQSYIAKGAYYLAAATLKLAQNGGIPPEKKQKAGQEVIVLARKALEIHTQLYGTEDDDVSNDMSVLAEALDYFNDDADEVEVFQLYEKAKTIYARLQGSSSVNVAVIEEKTGGAYCKSAKKAHDANDLDREVANLNLALQHFVESARILQAINRLDEADRLASTIVDIEELLRKCSVGRAAAAATKG